MGNANIRIRQQGTTSVSQIALIALIAVAGVGGMSQLGTATNKTIADGGDSGMTFTGSSFAAEGDTPFADGVERQILPHELEMPIVMPDEATRAKIDAAMERAGVS